MPKFTLITIGVVFLSFYALPSFAHPGSFMELVPLPGLFNGPAAISANGQVVVGNTAGNPGEQEAWYWTEETGMVALGDLPGGTDRSLAYGVSADGSVIVGVGNSTSGNEAFRWTASTGMVGLGTWRMHRTNRTTPRGERWM